ncbi:MAG TPA: cobalamin B12-binding domain-containing protein [Planctomycetota bacterium]|nr:cobalamin B12-binding domain-containing protein [Planctomycetota bacterium]
MGAHRNNSRAKPKPSSALSASSAVKAQASARRIRLIIGKSGLDGHDRGVKIVARALAEAGMEVIYTGLRQTPEGIAEAALQEDVAGVGLSILSGAHLTIFRRVRELLDERGLKHVLLFGGGIIPAEDVPVLARMGVDRVFGPGTSTADIVEYVRARMG